MRSLRVHLQVDESLDPDLLRALARDRVVLWLATASNTLRESVVENLGRFDEAWVCLRAPVNRTDADVFARIPKVGASVRAADLKGLRGRLPGVRRLALALDGPLDDATWRAISEVSPSLINWRPQGAVDLLQWAFFEQLPGRKLVAWPPAALVPMRCDDGRSSAAIDLHVATLLALGTDAFPCGKGRLVTVSPEVDDWLLTSLLLRDASTELRLEIGADAQAAIATRRLLERLDLGPAR